MILPFSSYPSIKIYFSSMCVDSKASLELFKRFKKTCMSSFSKPLHSKSSIFVIIWISRFLNLDCKIFKALISAELSLKIFLILVLVKKFLKSSMVWERYWAEELMLFKSFNTSCSSKIPYSCLSCMPVEIVEITLKGWRHWWAIFSIISPIEAILACCINISSFSRNSFSWFFCAVVSWKTPI